MDAKVNKREHTRINTKKNNYRTTETTNLPKTHNLVFHSSIEQTIMSCFLSVAKKYYIQVL